MKTQTNHEATPEETLAAIHKLEEYWFSLFKRLADRKMKAGEDHQVVTSAMLHAVARTLIDHLGKYDRGSHQLMLSDFSQLVLMEYGRQFPPEQKSRIITLN